MKDFSGKTVYITGGSSGIGLSVARLLAARGAHVVIFSRQRARLESALYQIESCRISGNQCFSYRQIDITRQDEVEVTISEAVRESGVPEVLINCAGIARPQSFENVTYDQFDETLKVNLFGARNIIAALVPYMKKQGGYIVNVSSMSGLIGTFGYSDYCASKFALIGFSEVLRSELKQYGIKVSVLCPPETKAMTAKAKLMHPDDVARALINGMKREKFLIIPGFEGKFYHMMKRLLPGLVEFIMDREIRRVQARKS